MKKDAADKFYYCFFKKLYKTIDNLDVTFSDSDSVYNLVSKYVLSQEAENVINQSKIGREMYTQLEERVTGTESIWNNMKKRDLWTFKTLGKTVKTKIQGKVEELKENRALIQRIIVVSQK